MQLASSLAVRGMGHSQNAPAPLFVRHETNFLAQKKGKNADLTYNVVFKGLFFLHY